MNKEKILELKSIAKQMFAGQMLSYVRFILFALCSSIRF